jgi:hypothetical protein
MNLEDLHGEARAGQRAAAAGFARVFEQAAEWEDRSIMAGQIRHLVAEAARAQGERVMKGTVDVQP